MNIDTILNKIYENSKQEENGCKIWLGNIDKKGACRLCFEKKIYIVHTFIWRYYHPVNLYNSNQNICYRTCGNKLCIEHTHLNIKENKKILSKQEIWEKLIKRGEKQSNGCLLWTGNQTNNYGSVSVNNKHMSVHRASYWIHNDIDEIPTKNENDEKLLIRHLCNNPLCFEPTHLKLGTQFENDYDDKIANNTLQCGEKHYNVKISEELAKEIKLSKYNGKSQRDRAVAFNVTLHIIKDIDSNKSWAHLPDADGNTGSDRKIKARELRKKAKERIWTTEMFEEAKDKLFNNSELSEDIKEPFVSTPCRIWQGNIDQGYGRITIFGKTMNTHVLACEIKKQSHKPEDKITRHLCGNKLCCEPDHMEFGTHKENSADMSKHGTNHLAKFTEAEVREIRETHKNDALTPSERAKKFNMTVSNLKSIEQNKTWKHVV